MIKVLSFVDRCFVKVLTFDDAYGADLFIAGAHYAIYAVKFGSIDFYLYPEEKDLMFIEQNPAEAEFALSELEAKGNGVL